MRFPAACEAFSLARAVRSDSGVTPRACPSPRARPQTAPEGVHSLFRRAAGAAAPPGALPSLPARPPPSLRS